MRASLTVRPAGSASFEVEVAGTATIGRSRANAVSLHFSPKASRQHAIIRFQEEGRYQIMDLGSRNGTSVNGRQVIMPVLLAHGDVIRIVDTEMVFAQTEEPVADPDGELTLATSPGATVDQNAVVAVMVCDIRGFSTMSEILPPKDLAHTLGLWFREAGDLVHETGGVIDKFIGDAVLAYWTRGREPGRESQNAFETGQRLLKKASDRRWPGSSDKPFAIAVALHHGLVTCRNVGFVAQRDATIIGDPVNTVFRIEGVMKSLGQKIALSGDLLDSLSSAPAGLNDLGSHHLKGKHQSVRLFGMA